MNAGILSIIASAVVVCGGLVSLTRAVWRAVDYLGRITRTLKAHETRLTHLEDECPFRSSRAHDA